MSRPAQPLAAMTAAIVLAARRSSNRFYQVKGTLLDSRTRKHELRSRSTGTVSTSVKPSANREYRLLSDATSAYAAAPSAAVLVKVRQKVTAALSANSIRLGQTVTIKGSVAPNHAGQSVTLQWYYSGAWHTAKTATLTSTNTYSFSYRPGSKGTRTLRVYRPADADHAAGNSSSMKLTIA